MFGLRRIRNRLGRWMLGDRIVADYDLAKTTANNRKRWSGADDLSADAALDRETRHVMRKRSRHAFANNGYASGIGETIASSVVGTGGRLRITDTRISDHNDIQLIQRKWAAWAKSIGLGRKTWTARLAQAASGEAFVLMVNDDEADVVPMNIRLIESDQVSTLGHVYQLNDDEVDHDGVIVNGNGRVVRYVVLTRHPGSRKPSSFFSRGVPGEHFAEFQPDQVFHLFKATRPGQVRGVPELAATLEDFEAIRDFGRAVVDSASTAASITGVLETPAPAEGGMAHGEPFTELELERNTVMVGPVGYSFKQHKAEQPTTTYSEFTDTRVAQAARAAHVPRNVALANSSGYNFASGKLDHQQWAIHIRLERSRLIESLLDPLFKAFWELATMREGPDPELAMVAARYGFVDDAMPPRHDWDFDGFEPVDPVKEASAMKIRLESGGSTLADEWAKQGKDYRDQMDQQKREADMAADLGLPAPLHSRSASAPVERSVIDGDSDDD